jgi:hypothetical protein
MPGYLIQYDEHPKWKNLKNQILSSCGHFVEHWQKKIKSNQVSLCCTVRARPSAVAMLSGLPSIVSSSPCPDPSQEKRRKEEKRTQGPLPVTLCPARYRPAWRRQRRPTGPRGRPSNLPARERERRDRSELATPPGPPCSEASGRLVPRRLGLYKAPSIKRRDAPHSPLPPRHRRSLPLALVRRRQPRRSSTGRAERRRVRAPGSKLLQGIGGGDEPPPIPHVADEPCFPYASPSPSNTRHCSQVSSRRVEEDDEPAPLDLDPTTTYRFGIC